MVVCALYPRTVTDEDVATADVATFRKKNIDPFMFHNLLSSFFLEKMVTKRIPAKNVCEKEY